MNRRTLLRTRTLISTLLLCLIVQSSVSIAAHGLDNSQSSQIRRPFRMLVLGDSVMWGQGLKEENKFSYKVRDWICAQRNNGICINKDDVQIHVEAHSGAVIARPEKKNSRKEEERFTRSAFPVRYNGEVNNAYPTVWGQVELARRYYEEASIPLAEVDLILVNGGINDMGPTRIITSFQSTISNLAKKYCEEEMKLLLEKLANTFPSARIIVPGYFPLLSVLTPENIVMRTIGYLFPDKKEKAIEREPREEPANPPSKPGYFQKLFADRSTRWTAASNQALENAVKQFNGRRSGPPVSAPPPEASMRALFVTVLFKDENAYAASKSFLWEIIPNQKLVECADDSWLLTLIAGDQLQTTRACACDQAGKRNDFFCVRAGAFHPNIQGAEAYSKAIIKELGRIVPLAGWATK